MNKYLTIVILTTLSSLDLYAQTQKMAPRLVVSVMIDQLTTEDLEQFNALYSNDGFKKILHQGTVYEHAKYDFQTTDLAASTSAVATGTTPYYNGVTAATFLNRNTLRPQQSTFDTKFFTSPNCLSSSTIGDELKMATNGAALVYAIAAEKDAAVLSGGHAADAAFWIDDKTKRWITSTYYPSTSQKWIKAYQATHQQFQGGVDYNASVKDLALHCVEAHAMGKDNNSDLLFVTFSAVPQQQQTNSNIAKEEIYRNLDKNLASLISGIENKIGKDQVVYFLTSSGYTGIQEKEYAKYKIPTGVFNISRTTNLLNIYLNAIYGSGRFVEATHKNEIYLNKKLIEQKHITYSDILKLSREFLIQISGIKEVYTADLLLFNSYNQPTIRNGFNPEISGDIILKVAPGWKILHEETKEEYTPSNIYIPFPIVIYGGGIEAKTVSTTVSTGKIAPTIAKIIRIRAPNACTEAPLPQQ